MLYQETYTPAIEVIESRQDDSESGTFLEASNEEIDTATAYAKKIVRKAIITALGVSPAVQANNVTLLFGSIESNQVIQQINAIQDHENEVLRIAVNNCVESFDKKHIIKQVLSFKSLVNNWDGYGAYPLEIDCAFNAISLVENFSPYIISKIDDLFPNPNGTVSFVWENKIGERVSLEIGNETMSYYVKYDNTNPLFYNKKRINEENISDLSSQISNLFS